MTDDGLKKLLAVLSNDPERAAELYLDLQNKLIRYFSWNMCATPDEFADTVLDRVARRVSEGVQIESPISYVLGVARRVLLEAKPQVLFLPLDGDLADVPDVKNETDLECLDSCLEEFPPESRALLLEYYSANQGERVRVRQLMAERVAVPVYP